MKTITIGRDAQCDVVVSDNMVSRVHCKITTDDGGNFCRIEDLSSRNGTYVNGSRISTSIYLNKGMSNELITIFKKHNIELIGLNEYLVMSCWLNDDKAVLAFPSKYATDEIGFFSQDPVFSKYIFTMFEGVKNQMVAKQAKRKHKIK